MGFFDFIRKLAGTEADSKLRKLDCRIRELQNSSKKLENDLEGLKHDHSKSFSWHKISLLSNPFFTTPTFVPRKVNKTRSMKDLLEFRKQEEEARKQRLEKQAENAINAIDNCLKQENLKQAEHLLFTIKPVVDEIDNSRLQNCIRNFQNDISNLKEILRRRAIERKKVEEKLRKEREEQDRLEKIRKEQIAERDRLEKERRAREYEEKLIQEEEKRINEIERLTKDVTRKKDNYQAYINHLRAHGVNVFYHFTDIKNLNSIRKLGGLYSWHYCINNGIEIPNPGGDEWSRNLDRRHDLEDYVRLSFCIDHPMAYRKKKDGARLVLLKIKIDVSSFADTQFSDVNAAATNSSHGSNLSDLQRVNIEATKQTYVSKDDPIFGQHQAECMVKTFLPINYILNIDNPEYMN